MMDEKKHIKILFIEDNETDAFVFTKMVSQIEEEREYSIDVVSTYEKALKAIKEKPYDLYFVDYILDEKTGPELINEASREGCKGPYILLTHHDNSEFYKKGAQDGIYDYLIKSELTPSMIDRVALYCLTRFDIEQKLKYEKESFDYVIANIPYAILHIDRNFLIRSMNSIAPKILGYNETDLIDKNVFDFISVTEKERLIDLFFEKDSDLVSFMGVWRTNYEVEKKTFMWDCLRRNMNDTPGYLFIGKDLTKELLIDVEEEMDKEDVSTKLDQIACNFGVGD